MMRTTIWQTRLCWLLRPRALVFAQVAAVLVAVVVGAATTACDPGHTVTYENQTSRTVTVFLHGNPEVTLGPFENKDGGILEFVRPTTFEAKDESGNVIYSATLTWEDLKQRGWKIVITENVPSPTPTGGR
jgi:hypothetical protein